MTRAFITGFAGLALSPSERAFLRDTRPAGAILFARNCDSAGQIMALLNAAREAVGGGAFLVLIDQEGGRVQRLKPPICRLLPPAAAYASLYKFDPETALKAAFAAARFVAGELSALGINTNCAPVLDVPVPGAHEIIGDRAYGATPAQIVDLARQVAEGHLSGGVLPVIKHIPGHGRATADSHLDLPIVSTPRAELSVSDFAPFKALNHFPVAMTAHVVYSAVDPQEPASTSVPVTRDVIRGEIGFDGLLMSDDLSMKALKGPMRERAAAVIAAGSDLALHCNGNLDLMADVAAGVPILTGAALARLKRAYALTAACQAFDVDEALHLIAVAERAHAAAVESV